MREKNTNEKIAIVLCKMKISKKGSVKLNNELTLETNCFLSAVLLEFACSERMTE